jgi:EAL and modified HD-GYP domain-containing signal transduction protein
LNYDLIITVTDMQMVANESPSLPLIDLRPVVNSAHHWVALSARLADANVGGDAGGDAGETSRTARFDGEALLTAIAPLDCVLHVATPAVLNAALLAKLPASRTVLAVDAAALDQPDALHQLHVLQKRGYRILIDGGARPGISLPLTLQAVAHDDKAAMNTDNRLAPLFGPHLAYAVDSPERFTAACRAGFAWFSGDDVLHASFDGRASDDGGITARRLLKLLGLLLADAETRDIEVELKQDPALSFQLLRLANSAAFAPAKPIHSFAQAIDLLGRRQLLRWLQLLMYARPRADGSPNPLLPIAALRAAQVESLCRQHRCPPDQQDLAFQVGVFSLLDVLLGMSMREIADTLRLPAEAAGALLARRGTMGAFLALVEAPPPSASALDAARVTPAQWWASQLDGFHWAIQVSRNL